MNNFKKLVLVYGVVIIGSIHTVVLTPDTAIRFKADYLKGMNKSCSESEKGKDSKVKVTDMLPDEFTAHEIVFEMLSKFFNDYTDIMDYKVVGNLNLLGNDSGSQVSILNTIGKTHTYFGRFYTSFLLTNVTTDIATLQQRQQIISFLKENDDVRNKMIHELEVIKSVQDNLLSLWSLENNEFYENFLNKVFSKKGSKIRALQHTLPYQYLAQTCDQFDLFNSVMGMNTRLMLAQTALTQVSLKFLHAMRDEIVKANPLLELQLRLKPLEVFIEGLKILYLGEQGNQYLIKSLPYYLRNYDFKHYIMSSIGLGITGYLAYRGINNYLQKKEVVDTLHAKMVAVAQFVKSFRNLFVIVEQNKELYENVRYADKLKKYFEKTAAISREMDELVELLHYSTFDSVTVMALRSRVKVAYLKCEEIKNEFITAFVGVAELDSFVGIADLMKTQENTPKAYSFVSYIADATVPAIKIVNGWHPLIQKDKVVKHDFVLDPVVTNIILTGPNAGGKTTWLKEIATHLVLGQSFGIAAAQSFEFTPFSTINTYMNIVDDLEKDQSLYEGEVARVKKVVKQVKINDSNNKLTFTIIDELLSGTHPTIGAQLSRETAEKLAAYKTSCTLLVTHFIDEMTAIESESGTYRNYKVDATLDGNGQPVYSYTVSPGVNRLNVARVILGEL